MAVNADGEVILTGETSDVNLPVTKGAYQTTCNQDSSVAKTNNYVRCGGESEGYLGSAFITKISADGTELVYSTYLHGFSGSEFGQAIAIDSAGDAVVLGQTGSSDFPITDDAFQSLCMPYYQPIGVTGGDPSDFYPIAQHCDGYYAGGGTEWVSGGPTLFIAKLDPTGSTLLYSTFFGGTNQTYPSGLALDSSDNIYFTSYLQGAEQYLQNGVPVDNWYPQNGTVPFPYTAGAFQQANLAQQVATLSELSADGHTLLYSTLFGATNTSNPSWIQPLALAVAPNGTAYVGGWTYSDGVPTTAEAVRPACVDSKVYNGGNESGNCQDYTGWLAAFDTTQTGAASLKYATYIGGPEVPSVQNQVEGLAVDSENNVYVTGFTSSAKYPTTHGAFSSVCTNFSAGNGNCNQTAYLTKINPEGSAYIWSTYFGGNQDSSSQGQAIGFDAKGRVYLFGYDNNYTYDLPFLNPLEDRPGNGSSYAFVATFTSNGAKLHFATPLGNLSPNAANTFPVPNHGMALDADGNIYFAAYGADGGTFINSSGTYATKASGGSNRTYFGKISKVLEPTATTLKISPSPAKPGETVTFTVGVVGTSQTTPSPTGTVSLTNPNTTPPTVLATISLSSKGAGTFSTSKLAAGTYPVTATYSGNTDYEVSTAVVSEEVLRNQAISFTLPAAVTYGVAPITLDGSGGTSGNPVIYTVKSGPAKVSGNVLTIKGVGTVEVIANQAGSSSYQAAPPVERTMIVRKAVMTVTAKKGAREYGSAEKTYGYAFTGLVDGNIAINEVTGKPILTTKATAKSPAGSYVIDIAAGTLASKNYSFKFEPGKLTITKAPLTITANNASRAVGAANPAFTYTSKGFVNGDTAKEALTGKPALTTSATATSKAGTYPIIVKDGTLAAKNYSFIFKDGKLTVTGN